MYKKGIWTWEAAHSGVGKVILSMDFKELITPPSPMSVSTQALAVRRSSEEASLCSVVAVMGIEPRASCRLGKHPVSLPTP